MEEKELPVVVEEEPKKEEGQPIGKALSAFIVSTIGLFFSITGVLSLPAVVLGIVGLSLHNGAKSVTRRPFSAFKNISKPFSIVAIAVGAVVTTALVITGIVFAILGIIKYASQY